MFNTFLPEEWVGYDQIAPGYDNVNGNIVYAQLVHRINADISIEEDAEQSLNRKYLIITGDEPIVVIALQPYKLMSELIESVSQAIMKPQDKWSMP